MDPILFPRTPAEQPPRDPDTLDLFAPASVDVPDIRTPAPAAPGSETSQAAAESITDPMRAETHRGIMRYLAMRGDNPASREQIADYLEVKESTLCARLYELRPLWVETVPGACMAISGRKVDGYRLTDAGKRRVQRVA